MKTLFATLLMAWSTAAFAATQQVIFTTDTVKRSGDTMRGSLKITGENSYLGVGTTNPDTKIHVVGSIKMVDGNQASGKIMTSDTNGVGSWQTASGGGVQAGDTTTWSGQNTFANTVYFSTAGSPIPEGRYAKTGAGGTLTFVEGGALPIDPLLIGVNIRQNSGTSGQMFSVPQGTTYYYAIGAPPVTFMPGGTATTSGSQEEAWTIPVITTGTLKNLVCIGDIAGSDNHHVFVNVRVNASSTGLHCYGKSSTSVKFQCNDTVHTFAVVPGDRISMSMSNPDAAIAIKNGACYVQLVF